MKIELHCDNGDVLHVLPEHVQLANIGERAVGLIIRNNILFMTFDGWQLERLAPVPPPPPPDPLAAKPPN